jgi:hypothetical protein
MSPRDIIWGDADSVGEGGVVPALAMGQRRIVSPACALTSDG